MNKLIRNLIAAAVMLPAIQAAQAATTPAMATISPDAAKNNFTAGPFTTAGTETYTLTVNLPSNYNVTNPHGTIRIGLAWQGRADLFTFTITDLDTNKPVVGQTNSTDLGFETEYVPAGFGTRRLKLEMSPLAPNTSTILGEVTLQSGDNDGLKPNPAGPGIPRYQQYFPPSGLSGNVGEPSVGYNVSSKQAFLLSGLKTLWLKFPQDLTAPLPQACDGEWAERSSKVTGVTTLDPIGVTDSLVRGKGRNRTWIGQLVGVNSAMAFSDDDGVNWTPNQGGPPLAATDHQTIAAGPYPASLAPALPTPVYPNAFYYCGQDVGFASCARSDDGGLTFNNPVPMYSINDCAGIHGHIRVAPDGTISVPSKACGTNVAIHVSTDAGITWATRPVPNSVPSIRDPSMAWASDNTGYFCYSNGSGRATVSVTKDKGKNWAAPVDLGAEMGIKHVMFTNAIAGDGDRAVCAYVATTTEGNPTAADFPGVWHVYFSTTYNGGKDWVTVNATPTDPVQGVGGIWNSGGSATNRNLNDFNEVTLDEKGYAIYGYADGCIGACDTDPTKNTYASFPKLVRQVGGKPLYSDQQTVEPRAPANACLSGVRTLERTQLTWRKPENGGDAITQYKVFRSTSPNPATTPANLVGTTDGTPSFVDTTADVKVSNYYYKVTALNSVNEGIASNEVNLPIVTPVVIDPCTLPGVRLITDAVGDSQGGVATGDVLSLDFAEPQSDVGKLIITMKVASLTNVPPGTMYAVRFHTPAQSFSSTNDSFIGLVFDGSTSSFVYGTRTDETAEVVGYQFYNVTGPLPAGSVFKPDGTITFSVPRSLYGLTDGSSLSALSMNAHTGATATGQHVVRSTNTLDSASTGDPYVLRTATLCIPNTPPVASFKVTPVSGNAPLTVSVDGSGSSDAEDAVTEFTFTPGDGSAAETKSTPSFSHTYSAKGFYTATLKVKDARGLVSSNTASQAVEVTEAVQQAVTPFTFIERNNVPVNSFVTSEAVTLAGFTGSLQISIVNGGGQYSINGGAFTNSVGSVSAGAKLVVRHLSATAENTSVTSTVSVGSYSTPFKSTTTTVDRVPDAFSFGSQSGMNPGAMAESAVTTLANFDTATIVAGPDVEYRINGGSYTKANGTLIKGQTLQVRHITNSAHLGYTKTYLKVGGVTGYFTTRTK